MNRYEIDVIENAVKISDVLSLHRVSCVGMRCRCPIHQGKRLSFSFTDKLFHCFTCGASGGVIQLEALLDNTSCDEACKTLAKEYGLDISHRPWTEQEKQEWLLNKKVEDDFNDYNQEQRNYYLQLSTLYRNIKDEPELSELAGDLNEWLDNNIDGAEQPWRYLNIL